MRLLLVEDDDAIAIPLVRLLEGAGYRVDWVASAAGADRAAGLAEVVVLDLGLPDGDGVQVCRRLRARFPVVPILILTARDAEVDVVVGLDAGADDYVAKPFRVGELLARLRALGRATAAARVPAGGSSQAVGGVMVDLAARRVMVEGREVALTVKEFELLALLVAHAGEVLGRARIIEQMWDAHWFGSTKTLDVHVSALRRKLGGAVQITPLRGVGYRLEVGG